MNKYMFSMMVYVRERERGKEKERERERMTRRRFEVLEMVKGLVWVFKK